MAFINVGEFSDASLSGAQNRIRTGDLVLTKDVLLPAELSGQTKGKQKKNTN